MIKYSYLASARFQLVQENFYQIADIDIDNWYWGFVRCCILLDDVVGCCLMLYDVEWCRLML